MLVFFQTKKDMTGQAGLLRFVYEARRAPRGKQVKEEEPASSSNKCTTAKAAPPLPKARPVMPATQSPPATPVKQEKEDETEPALVRAMSRLESMIKSAWPRQEQLTGLRNNGFIPISGPPPTRIPGAVPARARYETCTPMLSELDYNAQMDLEIRALCLASSVVSAMDHDFNNMNRQEQIVALDKLWAAFNNLPADNFPKFTGTQLALITRYIEIRYNCLHEA
jgi:hypothetical protein